MSRFDASRGVAWLRHNTVPRALSEYDATAPTSLLQMELRRIISKHYVHPQASERRGKSLRRCTCACCSGFRVYAPHAEQHRRDSSSGAFCATFIFLCLGPKPDTPAAPAAGRTYSDSWFYSDDEDLWSTGLLSPTQQKLSIADARLFEIPLCSAYIDLSTLQLAGACKRERKKDIAAFGHRGVMRRGYCN